MTEKRYILSHNGKEDGILDKTNDKGYYGFELARLVNELSEENEQLKQSEKDCQEWNHKLINENEQLKKENEKLKEIFMEQLENALTLSFVKEVYCNALLRILDENDSVESAKEYIKDYLSGDD